MLEIAGEITERLRKAAEVAGIGAVPPKDDHLFRLSPRSRELLGWSEQDEIFGVMDVQAMLGMLGTEADRYLLRRVLETGNRQEILTVAEKLEPRTRRAGLFGIVVDYLAGFEPMISSLSPRSETGIF